MFPTPPSEVTGSSFSVSSSTDFDTVTGIYTEEGYPHEMASIHRDIDTPAISSAVQLKDKSKLSSLPDELQLQIFGYLDKIDAACFGLSSPKSYPIFREIHGTKMPLNTRRVGPNPFESAWEIVGIPKCKHCGVYRCELWQHLKTWMPKELEYCTLKQNFGPRAEESASETCRRGKPSKPNRCGRHPVRTTTIHQDDPLMPLDSKL